MKYMVTRYRIKGGDPDRLRVLDGDTKILDVVMGPGGPLHPRDVDEARARPWFYSGSPHGEDIVQLARKRGII